MAVGDLGLLLQNGTTTSQPEPMASRALTSIPSFVVVLLELIHESVVLGRVIHRRLFDFYWGHLVEVQVQDLTLFEVLASLRNGTLGCWRIREVGPAVLRNNALERVVLAVRSVGLYLCARVRMCFPDS